jgi:hypothetical protein
MIPMVCEQEALSPEIPLKTTFRRVDSLDSSAKVSDCQ